MSALADLTRAETEAAKARARLQETAQTLRHRSSPRVLASDLVSTTQERAGDLGRWLRPLLSINHPAMRTLGALAVAAIVLQRLRPFHHDEVEPVDQDSRRR